MSLLSARLKRACCIAVTYKTVKKRRQLWWTEEKSRGKNEIIAWPERQMMLATGIIHMYRIFLYTTFQKM